MCTVGDKNLSYVCKRLIKIYVLYYTLFNSKRIKTMINVYINFEGEHFYLVLK